MNNVISRQQKSAHDEKVRTAHVNAIKILKAEIEKTQGVERNLLDRTEAYHVARLHNQWFSLGRSENEKFIARKR
jgi:hypothetical protein